MKKLFTLLLVLSFSVFGYAQTTIDFETVGQDWTWTVMANADDSPTYYSVVTNPDNTGINTSANVAKFDVQTAADPWAGVWSVDADDFTFDATNCIVKIMVYKDVISNFGFKIQGADGDVELKVANTVVNQWEELTFDFSAHIGKVVSTIVIMPDFSDPRTVGSTNYWDNISFNAIPPSVATIDFETVGQDWSWTVMANDDDSPTYYSVVTNPDNTGINTSANVAKFDVQTAADPWAGVWSADADDFAFDASNSEVRIMVYKDVISNFAFKIQGADGDVELKVANTLINEWEELTFDFSDHIGKVVSTIVIMPDFSDPRTVGSTNYWDNISFHAVVVTEPAVAPIIDFETVGNGWTWTMFSNADADAGFYSVVANPDNTGINTSANVAKLIVKDAADPWVGVWSEDFDGFILDATNSLVKVMVYKDVISNFGFKVEGADLWAEIKVANTVANEWEELTIDLSTHIGKTVSKLTIMPDFSDPRTVGSTNYWDNITFNAQIVEAPIIDYETVGNDWTWTMFSNADADAGFYSVVANPDNTGINTSANVAKFIVKDAADPWAGVWSEDFDGFILDATNSLVKIMVYKDVISNFGFKVEGTDLWAEIKVANTVTNEWEELTIDLSTQIGKTVSKLTIMPDFSDPRTVGSTNYWDNITFTTNEAPLSAPRLPIDFEEPTVFSYIWNDFGASIASVVSNPDASGENTSAMVAEINKTAGAETGAGSFMNLGEAIDFSTSTIIKMKVYAPRVADTIILKLESSQSSNKPEIKMLTTLVNTWEVLEFDFAGFTGFSASNNYDRIVIFADYGNWGDGGLFYFDDIEVVGAVTAIEVLDHINFNVYPNPASDFLYISNISDLKRVEIYSITGQKVRTFEFINNKIEIADLPKGVYVLSAENFSGEVFTSKFLKN